MAVRYTSVELENLIQEAASGEKFPLAKLITELEKPDSFEFRKILFQKLEEQGFTEKKP